MKIYLRAQIATAVFISLIAMAITISAMTNSFN